MRATAKQRRVVNGYDQAFEEVRAAYPKRAGDQRWTDAATAYAARLKAGDTHEEILAGVIRYAAYVRAKGDEGGQYVKQAASFLGTNRSYLDRWDPPPSKAQIGQDKNLDATRTWLAQSEASHEA